MIGSIWLLYKGAVYVLAAIVERGAPPEEKEISVTLAWIIALTEIAFIGAVVMYLMGQL